MFLLRAQLLPIFLIPLMAATLTLILAVGCSEDGPPQREMPGAPPPAGEFTGGQLPEEEPAADLESEQEQDQESLPEARIAEPGAVWSQEQTTFRVWAPAAESITVGLFPTTAALYPEYEFPMTATAGGWFEAAAPGDWQEWCYHYLVTTADGSEIPVADPRAVNMVDSSRKARITPPGTAAPPGWENKPPAPVFENQYDAVIYEIHVRDLTMHPDSGHTHRGRYLGVAETGTTLRSAPDGPTTGLDHIRSLGATHIHLMPVMDFDNDETEAGYNWGYMPVGFFSPEGMYASSPHDASRITEMKELVAACHAHGIGVIIDVVYNHYANDSILQVLAGNEAFRVNPDGSLANGSNCGNDLDTEHPEIRALILDSAEHWVREYDIDGFRFDIMGLIDLETMQQLEERLLSIKPSLILYGEHWKTGPSPIRGPNADLEGMRQLQRIGAFNDSLRDAIKGSPNGEDKGFVQDGSHITHIQAGLLGQRDWGLGCPGRIVQYNSVHDDLTLRDKLERTLPGASEEEIRKRAKLAHLIALTAQGTAFLHAGCEFMRTKGGSEDSFDLGDEVNQLDWNLLETHQPLVDWVRDLVHIRRTQPMFRLGCDDDIRFRVGFPEGARENILFMHIEAQTLEDSEWREAIVVINPTAEETLIELPPGTWEIVLNTEAHPNTTRTENLTLPPVSGRILKR